MEKVILDVDKQSIKAFLENVSNCIIKLNDSEKVKNTHKVQTSEELIAKYQKKSGFTNIEMVIKGYELQNDLDLLRYTEGDLSALLPYIEMSEGVFTMTPSAEAEIKERFTHFMNDEDAKMYYKLEKICRLLDEVGTNNRYIHPSGNGWQVNKIMLHSKA